MAPDLQSATTKREETLLAGAVFVLVFLATGIIFLWEARPERTLEGLYHFLSLQLKLMAALAVAFTIFIRVAPRSPVFVLLRHITVLYLAFIALVVTAYSVVKVHNYNNSDNCCVGYELSSTGENGMTFDLRDPKALNKLTVQVNEVLKSRAVGLIEPLLYRLGIPTGTLVVRKTREGYDNVDNLGSGMKNIIEYKTRYRLRAFLRAEPDCGGNKTLEFELIIPNKEKRSLPHTTKRSGSTCLVPQPGVDHRQAALLRRCGC